MLSYIRGDKNMHTKETYMSKSATARVNTSMETGTRVTSLNGSAPRVRNAPSNKSFDDPAGIITAASAVGAGGEDHIEDGYEDIGRLEDRSSHQHQHQQHYSRKSAAAPVSSATTVQLSAHSRHSSGNSRLTVISAKTDKDLESTVVSIDANFKQGLQLIQQAYEDRHTALLEEVQHWKLVAEEQSEQMEAMAAELARVEANFASLQKEMSQLQMFRRAIVTMVDQHSGVALTELEQSILETIEANDDRQYGGNGSTLDPNADTSSFMLGSDAETSFRANLGLHSTTAPIRVARPPVKLEDSESTRQPPLSSSVPKRSSMVTQQRQRASTDVMARSSSVQDRNRPSTSRGPASPPNARPSPNISSSSRNNNLHQYGQTVGSMAPVSKQASRMSSAEALRSKRNTISASTARPLYPNQAAMSVNNTSSAGQSNAVSNYASTRRSSNASPLSPPLRAAAGSLANASARLKSGSTSFSSTPSSSPRQGQQMSTNTDTTGTSAAKPTQQQLQKDYHMHVKNLMSQQAGLSTLAATTTASSSALSPDKVTSRSKTQSGGAAEDDYPSAQQQHHKLSPAAQELLKRQKMQQELDQEHVAAKRGHHPSAATAGRYYQNENERRYHSGGYGSSSASVPSRSHEMYQQRHQQNSRSNLAQQGTSLHQQQQQQVPQQQSGGVDASAFTTLYKEIRDSMDVASFSQFAKVVTAFNEGDKTTEETLQEVSRIVKDRGLNKRFQDLILMAIADKERQDEEAVGDEVEEGNVSMISANITIDPDELDDETPITRQHEASLQGGGDIMMMATEPSHRRMKANRTLGQSDIEDDLSDVPTHPTSRSNMHEEEEEEEEEDALVGGS